MNEIIKVVDLHKVYRKGNSSIEALRGIDLEISGNESTLIVGPSGAGKSTLLQIMGGLLSPTVGRVFFGDIDLYSRPDAELARIRNERIGFVFQFYHLLPEFNALENVLLPSILKGKKLQSRAKDLLAMVGLKDRMDHKPGELSGGEAQRVAIARALINNPDVILCDEPTGNLDSETGSLIYKILWRINKEEGKALIVVTHNEVMREDFNNFCYIKDGQVVRGQFSSMHLPFAENCPR